jgi:DNA-binding NarL/FixJ family response regulator
MSKINIIIFLKKFFITKSLACIAKEINIDVNLLFPKNIDEFKQAINAISCDMLFVDEFFAQMLDREQFTNDLSKSEIIVVGKKRDFEFIKIFDFISEDIAKTEIYEKIKFYLEKFEETNQEENILSEREKDILRLVAQGFTNKEIADKLFLSIHTVATHRKNISNKLGIKSISGLTIYAILNGIISIDNSNLLV